MSGELQDAPGFEATDAGALASSALTALAAIPQSRWHESALIVRPEGVEVTTRDELAAYFRANDLRELAARARAVRVRPGSVLVWVEGEDTALQVSTPTPLLVAVIESMTRPMTANEMIAKEQGT